MMMNNLCPLCQKPILDKNYISEQIEDKMYLVHIKCLKEADEIFDEEDDLSMFGKNMFLFADDNLELNKSEE